MKRIRIIIFVVLFFSCYSDNENRESLFTLLSSSETGITFSNDLSETEDFNIIDYLYFNNGAGVAAADFNNDGLVDIFFTGSQVPNRLFVNKGNLQFEDITDRAGVGGSGDWKTGVSISDVNADGYIDIYVCGVNLYKGLEGANQLFLNNGDLTFTDKAPETGLDFQGFSTQSAFFDYDNDGDLDLFLLNHSVHSTRSYGNVDLREEFDPRSGDRLYRNELQSGTLTFTDVTEEAGIYSSQIGYGLNVSVGDINNDGYADLYVSNDFHEIDYLYMNNGDGTFAERFNEMMLYSSRSSMGNDIADFNNDGLLDVIVLDMLPEEEKIRQRVGGEDDYDVFNIKLSYGYNYQFVRNTLQMNLGGDLFSEIGRYSGIYATDWSWSPLFCDLDNDGWKDLHITNGIFRRPNDLDYIRFLTGRGSDMKANVEDLRPDHVLYEQMPLDKLVNYVYQNNKDLTFSNKSVEWGLNNPSYSNGAAYADLDNDGDLDLIVNNINEEAFVYRNNSDRQSNRHFLQLEFEGPALNKKGIGVRVKLFNGNKVQMAENFTTRGFFSSVAPVLHFGLDSQVTVDSMEVIWPDGNIQKIYGIEVDQKMRIKYEKSEMEVSTGKKFAPGTLFIKSDPNFNINFIPKEDSYDEFYYEMLIPHKLAFQGPCIAVGDVNDDGLQDIFIGAPYEQPSRLLLQNKEGNFVSEQEDFFKKEAFYEDVDAVFFDADQDLDLDLYVVSGGNHHILPNPLMQDRLYLNDGKGNFSRSRDILPVFSHNGSCVAPGDFDNDGDIDIFSGSRSIPRAYGLEPQSFLLVNNGMNEYSDVTEELIPELNDLGMITAAGWSDLDQDNDMDLIVCGEWMPITIFRNEPGGFTKLDKNGVFDEGWWFSLRVADIDMDGDDDIIAGNLGLNSYLEASKDYPVKMYLNDFDGNGSLDQIITYCKEGKEYPFAPADYLFRQIPPLQNRFESYQDFAGKSIREIIPEKLLDQAIVKKVTCFESAIFLNTGNFQFEKHNLPVEVQFSPVNDMLIRDFTNDNIPDLLIGGNYIQVIPYFGQYNASYGWFLKGLGKGQFDLQYPFESGFSVKGEIRDMEMIEIGNRNQVIIGRNNEKPEFFMIQN